ncbi:MULTISPECIES: hypothetical protein [unclassified Nocardiopsis]|uniref:hypothetical protein n=1 Tax=unclassified Nocardiopsis TaxID=2649073 RepID=UPI001357934E|nr:MULTISPECIES: hypothetical protein [unclassified Nocardiopsis]
MSDDLINPDEIPVPIVNTVLLESAARGIRTDGENIAESGQSIKTSWAGLQEVYSAPEASTLYAAVNPVATTGDEVETDFDKAATALEAFAETARELRSKLIQARQDARDLVAEIRSDDDWDEGGFFGGESEKVEEHNNLLNHVNSLHQQYQEAERECANAITALFGGTTFIAGNAEGTTQPGAGEAVYGFEEAPEDVETPWGTPQSTDHMWHVDAVHGGWDVIKGSAEDMGGAVGAHGSEGWWDGGWWNNFSSYWGDSLTGLGAMTGFYNPQTGAMVNSPGEWWDTARGAWGDAIHGFFPWTELGERPGYVFGTVLTNVGMIAAGAALSATGVGAVVGVPMIAARVSRILGGAGTGDGPISGGIDAGGTEGPNGSSNTGNNMSTSPLRPDGTHPDAPTAPDRIEADSSDAPAGIGDMNETLRELESYQNQGPQTEPSPTPEHRSDPVPESSASPEPATPGSDTPQRSSSSDGPAGEGTTTPQEADSPNADTPGQRADEGARPDPTTEEIDAAFAEIARRNEDVADSMDRADNGQMAGLDGEERWTISALENSDSHGRDHGQDPDVDSPVLVTPDGMEARADHNVENNVNDGGARSDDSSDPVTIHEDQTPNQAEQSSGGPSTGGTSGGGPPEPPRPPGPAGPDGPNPPEPSTPTAEKPTGPMLDSQVDGVRDILDSAGLNGQKVDDIITTLKNDGTTLGQQVADILLEGRVSQVRRFDEFVSDFANQNMVPAAGTELRFMDNLLQNGYAPERLEFAEKKDQQATADSSQNFDIDALIRSDGLSGQYAYQIKRLDVTDGTIRESAIVNNTQKIGKQLRTLPPDMEGTRTVGILEVNAPMIELSEKAMNRILSNARRFDTSFRVYFSDGVMTFPDDAQIYPPVNDD